MSCVMLGQSFFFWVITSRILPLKTFNGSNYPFLKFTIYIIESVQNHDVVPIILLNFLICQENRTFYFFIERSVRSGKEALQS